MLFVYIKMTFAVGAERGGALKSVCRNMLAGNLYFPFPFLSKRTVQWRLSLARLPLRTWSRLKIGRWCWSPLSLGRISGLRSGCCPDKSKGNTRRQKMSTSGLRTHIRCEGSIPVWPTLNIPSLSNRWWVSPGCHLCCWPLFRGGVQEPQRDAWQRARSASEPSYRWHRVSRRCHVFILREFNPPFRMDQTRRCCGGADKCSRSCSLLWEMSRK